MSVPLLTFFLLSPSERDIIKETIGIAAILRPIRRIPQGLADPQFDNFMTKLLSFLSFLVNPCFIISHFC